MQEVVNVLCDSQSAIHLATNPSYHRKTKHIDVRCHFLRRDRWRRSSSQEGPHNEELCRHIHKASYSR